MMGSTENADIDIFRSNLGGRQLFRTREAIKAKYLREYISHLQ